jgi:hypothetical protein
MLQRFPNKGVAFKPISLAMLIGIVGGGSLCIGEEVIILDKQKTKTLAEWDKPVLFGSGNWKVVDDSAGQVLQLRTESSSFALEKSITVDLKRTPYLEWEWKGTVLPTGGNFASPETDDQAGQLIVVFPKTFFERRKVIAYIWDPTAPKGTIAAGAGPIYLNVKAIVVESGYSQIGKWLVESATSSRTFERFLESLRNTLLPSVYKSTVNTQNQMPKCSGKPYDSRLSELTPFGGPPMRSRLLHPLIAPF